MITREKIVDSIDYVVNQSNYVSINKGNISSVLPLLSEIRKTSWLNSDVLDLSKLDEEQVILYFLLCESFNFCFWDSDIKWKIEYHGEWYSGSYALSSRKSFGIILKRASRPNGRLCLFL